MSTSSFIPFLAAGGAGGVAVPTDHPVYAFLAGWLVAGLLVDIAIALYLVRGGDRLSRQRVAMPPWSAVEVWMVLLALFGLSVVAAAAAELTARLLGADAAPGGAVSIACNGLLLQGIGIIVLLQAMGRHGIAPAEALGLRNGRLLAAAATAPVLLLAITPPIDVIQLVMPRVMEWFGADPRPQEIPMQFVSTSSPWLTALIALFAVGLAPIYEELFFRGFLYRSLRPVLHPVPAAVVGAAIFAAFHMNLALMPALFFLGLGLTLAYELTGSLATAILVHAAFNARSLILMFILRGSVSP